MRVRKCYVREGSGGWDGKGIKEVIDRRVNMVQSKFESIWTNIDKSWDPDALCNH